MNKAAVHTTVLMPDDFQLSRHAWQRMGARGFSPATISNVLSYGRIVYVRGAKIYAVGRKEINRYQHHGINLSRLEGMQVICTESGVIKTAYRNRNFRTLKPRSRSNRQ